MKRTNNISVFPLVKLAFACLLIPGTGCQQLAPYTGQPYEPADKEFLCSAQIFRSLDNGSEFTEDWEAWIFPYVGEDTSSVCNTKLTEYITKSMAPGFSWGTRNLTVTESTTTDILLDKENVSECREDFSVALPNTYGSSEGAVVVWQDPVPLSQATVRVTTKNDQGVPHSTSSPEVLKAILKFAEHQGVFNEGVYDPDKHNVRVSDFFLELKTPFDLEFDFGTMQVTKSYIQSIGTISTEVAAGITYPISTFQGKSKLYWFGQGEIDGEQGTTSFCFSNTLPTGITEYQGAPNQSFAFSLNIPSSELEGMPLSFFVSLSSPAGQAFNQHQPFIFLFDRETSDPSVDLSVGLNATGPDGVAFDHDGEADLARISHTSATKKAVSQV